MDSGNAGGFFLRGSGLDPGFELCVFGLQGRSLFGSHGGRLLCQGLGIGIGERRGERRHGLVGGLTSRLGFKLRHGVVRDHVVRLLEAELADQEIPHTPPQASVLHVRPVGKLDYAFLAVGERRRPQTLDGWRLRAEETHVTQVVDARYRIPGRIRRVEARRDFLESPGRHQLRERHINLVGLGFQRAVGKGERTHPAIGRGVGFRVADDNRRLMQGGIVGAGAGLQVGVGKGQRGAAHRGMPAGLEDLEFRVAGGVHGGHCHGGPLAESR